MKLLLSVLAVSSFFTSLAAAAGASTFIAFAQAVPNSVQFDSVQTQLAFANGSVYFGDVKYAENSEPLILNYPGGNGPGGTGGLSFTSWHAAQTGWQTFYIFPAEVKPIGFTQPHSGSIPPNAAITGYSVRATDKFLRYDNYDGWYACKPNGIPVRTYQVFYIGQNKVVPPGCIKINIWTTGYGSAPWP